MTPFVRDLVAVDRQRLDLRAGVVGLVVLAVFGVAVASVGPVAIAAAVGALVVLASEPPAAGRSFATTIAPLVAGGAAATLLAVWLGDRAVLAAMLAAVVVGVTTLHSGDSDTAATRALVVALWVVMASTLHDGDDPAWAYALAFAIGGLVGALVAAARLRSSEAHVAAELDAPVVTSVPPSGSATSRSFVQVALLRGVGVGVAVFIGFTWFPEHSAWVAITSLVVLRPPTRQALLVGVQRSLGTGVGVLIAVAVADAIGDSRPGLVVMFLVSAFVMMVVREANYALFAVVVTALVVYSQRLLGADAADSGRDRLVETLLGVVIAFVVLGLTALTATDEGTSR